jgi:tetratricopeptide (TPR) repeat protein
VRLACGPAALVLGGLLLGGCASGQATSLTGRLIRPGQPAVDLGGPELSGDSEQLRQLSAEGAPRTSTFGATIESIDQRLAAALLLEASAPTAENHIRVADEYRRLGVQDAAFERLTMAVKKNRKMAEAHAAIARAWRDWGLPGRGLSAAYRAVYFGGESAAVQNTLATMLDALGEVEGARDAYQRAVTLNPTAAWALSNLCYLEFRVGRLAEARSLCEASLRQSPGFAAARNNLALVHAASGDVARARTELLSTGDLATGHYNLGMLFLARANYAAAAESFEEAIKLRPSFAAAKTRAHAARLRLLTGGN